MKEEARGKGMRGGRVGLLVRRLFCAHCAKFLRRLDVKTMVHSSMDALDVVRSGYG
jgi:hypothetical protein